MFQDFASFRPERIATSKVGRQATALTITIWVFTFFLFLTPQLAATGHVPSFSLVLYALLIATGGLLSAALYWFASRLKSARSWIKLTGVASAVCMIALAFSLFDSALGGPIVRLFMAGHHIPPDLLSMTVSNFISYSWLFGLLGSGYVILHGSEALRERDVQLIEARSLVQAAQLAALRLQLNPHFLFNTLNAISSLIVNNRMREGEAMLGKLSSFLRAALAPEMIGTVSLGAELDAVQTYLEIESVRFGDRLTVEFACTDELLDHKVPSFILQPLVENAVKHGVAPTKEPVLIEVIAERSRDELLLTVSNSVRGVTDLPTPGTGIGIANTAHRLHVLYGSAGRIETRTASHRFDAVVHLPFAMQPEPA